MKEQIISLPYTYLIIFHSWVQLCFCFVGLCGVCFIHSMELDPCVSEWVSEKVDSSLWNCVSKQCFCFFRMRWWHRYSQRRTLFNLLVVYFIFFLILRKKYIHFSYKKLGKTLRTALHPFFRPFKLTLFILFIFLILNTPRLSRGKN